MERDERGRFFVGLGVLHGCHCGLYVACHSYRSTGAELRRVLGQAGQHSAEKRARGCARPVRLVGSTSVVNRETGQVGESYGSADELDGYTYVRCGNRRAAVCPSCSRSTRATRGMC